MNPKPRLNRLTAILTQLQSTKIVTARDIAEKHDVSIRTVYRDIRTLESTGIPIFTEEGRGYSIMEGYKIPPIMFTEEEANALITAQKIINNNKDSSLAKQYGNAILKIKSVLKTNQKETTELLEARIQIRDNVDNLKTSNYVTILQSAITSFNLIDLSYNSLVDISTKRLVEPFALFSTQDNWVLIAYCRLRKDYRYFRLDCIERIIVTNKKFEPHKMSLQEYFENCKNSWDKDSTDKSNP